MGEVAKFLGFGPAPKAVTPTAVPTRRGADIQAERRKKQQALAEKGVGRQGTILTPQKAAPLYENTLLGE